VSSRDPTEEMTCSELVELVTDYLEGRLASPDVSRFESHLATCEGCRNYLDQMRETIEVLGRLREDSITPEARDRMLNAFRGWKGG
jgi:predicted anti-sigma-YlaC factor YlaD